MPASANLGSVETLIDAVEATDSKADFPGALTLLSGSLSPVEGSGLAAPRPDRSFVVLLSDYLDGSLDLAATSTDASQSLGGVKLPDGVRLISSTPSTEAASNISITALEPLRSVLVDAAKGAGATGNADPSGRVGWSCLHPPAPNTMIVVPEPFERDFSKGWLNSQANGAATAAPIAAPTRKPGSAALRDV